MYKNQYKIKYQKPYNWNALLSFYSNHLIKPVEQIEADKYIRFVNWQNEVVRFACINIKTEQCIFIEITSKKQVANEPQFVANIERMLDIQADYKKINRVLKLHNPFDTLTKTQAGLRIPGGWDLWSVGIYAILGQLVSMQQAMRLAAQLLVICNNNTKFETEEQLLFPTPEQLLKADLTTLSTTLIRKNTLRNYATFILQHDVIKLTALDSPELIKQLLTIKGIGIWTAQVIAIRATAATDVFPKTDLILKRALDLFPKLEMDQLTPYKSYAAFYLWSAYADQLRKTK